jgi:hypothetical protein
MTNVDNMIREHYRRPEVKEIITRSSRQGQYVRCGNGNFINWYRYIGNKKYHLNICDDYEYITSKYRVLYWSLNMFEPTIFKQDYSNITSEESPILSRKYTGGYTFGVDIDTVPDKNEEHGLNINAPEITEAVEAMAQYYCNRLREYAPNSIHACFSGGGIYVYIHHMAVKAYFDRYYNDPEWDLYFRILYKAFNNFLGDIRNDFFKEYPQYEGKVKPDLINSAKRVYKSIFSIHKKHNYAVIPLDVKKIKINFADATLPLSTEIIERGKDWYMDYDIDNGIFEALKPYQDEAEEEERNKTTCVFNSDYDMAQEHKTDIEQWPPCIKNMLKLKSCGEGRTRALALLAAFLGQANVPEDQARAIFNELVNRWGATGANIFDSYYKKMKVPTCKHLRENNNTGFPIGKSIRSLGICEADMRCIDIFSPRYYVDKPINKKIFG